MSCVVQAGLDSLGAVEVRNALVEKFYISVPATVVFDYPTPQALQDFIISNLKQSAGRQELISSSQDLQNLSEGTQAVRRAPKIDSKGIESQVLAIVESVLGSAASAQQPLMEVIRLCQPLLPRVLDWSNWKSVSYVIKELKPDLVPLSISTHVILTQ